MGIIFTIPDLPSRMMNNYCSDRKPIKFLKEEHIKCNVKITDLEIFNILNIFNDSSVISVTEKYLNTSTLVKIFSVSYLIFLQFHKHVNIICFTFYRIDLHYTVPIGLLLCVMVQYFV